MPTLAELYPAYGIQAPSIGLGALGGQQGGSFASLPIGALAALVQQQGASRPALASYGRPTQAPTSGAPNDYLSAIRGFEGFSERPYWDVRQWTSGYGTRANGPNDVVDRAEADRRLQSEWTSSLGQVRGLGAPLTPGREAALASLTFNAGPSWMTSGLGSAVRAGDWDAARQLFLQYNRAGGQYNPGLANRRAAEAAWFGY
jgi:GH24 family phage-related lysozyme (muramidase)